MTVTRVSTAKGLSDALSKSLPVGNRMVNHFRDLGVWDQAIIEALATFADAGNALPVDVRELAEQFVNDAGVSATVRRHAGHYLAEIPA